MWGSRGIGRSVAAVAGAVVLVGSLAVASSAPSVLLYLAPTGAVPVSVRTAAKRLALSNSYVIGSTKDIPNSRFTGLVAGTPTRWDMNVPSLSVNSTAQVEAEFWARWMTASDLVSTEPLVQAAAVATSSRRSWVMVPPHGRITLAPGLRVFVSGE